MEKRPVSHYWLTSDQAMQSDRAAAQHDDGNIEREETRDSINDALDNLTPVACPPDLPKTTAALADYMHKHARLLGYGLERWVATVNQRLLDRDTKLDRILGLLVSRNIVHLDVRCPCLWST